MKRATVRDGDGNGNVTEDHNESEEDNDDVYINESVKNLPVIAVDNKILNTLLLCKQSTCQGVHVSNFVCVVRKDMPLCKFLQLGDLSGLKLVQRKRLRNV